MSNEQKQHMPVLTMVGRADLLRCLGYYSAAELAEAGSICGFTFQDDEPALKPEKFEVITGLSRETIRLSENVATNTAIQYVRVTEYKANENRERNLAVPEWARVPLPYTDGNLRADETKKKPEMPPLSPWKREWPFLRAAFGRQVATRELDCERAIRIIASGEPIHSIPRKTAHGWVHSCQVILDMDLRLRPFWDDMHKVVGELVAMRPRSGLRILELEPDHLDGCRDYFNRSRESFPYSLPEPGGAVLVISDLGCYAKNTAVRGLWARMGKRLREHGINPVALMPCPPRLWNSDAVKYWHPVFWDRDVRLPDCASKLFQAGRNRRCSTRAGNAVTELLTVLSPAVRIEPELLRAVRTGYPGKRLDAGVEGEAWNHDHVKSCTLGFAFDAEQRRIYLEKFRELPSGIREAVFSLLKQYHRHLSRDIRFEEELTARLLIGDHTELEAKDDFLKRMFDSIGNTGFREQGSLKSYVRRMFIRMGNDIWINDEKAVALWLKTHVWERELDCDADGIPPGIDLGKFRWLFADREAISFQLRQIGTDLTIVANDDTTDRDVGMPIVDFTTTAPVIEAGEVGEAYGKINLHGQVPSFKIREEKRFRVDTGECEYDIESISKPVWAAAMAREGGRLVATLPEKRRLIWLNPGRYSVALGLKQTEIVINKGFWWDEEAASDWRTQLFDNLDWADKCGVDEYGIYADFSISKVRQRMRWIWPGEFTMGSPEKEPERLDKEKPHRVILSEGFWLGETACAQELWQRVMKKNPSKFKDSQLPVESVSWDDCVRFLKAINAAKPGIDLRLPSEAEWEYACRAGNETPFSFGDNITTDQVNYNGNYPYNGDNKGEYRKTTVPVASLACNGWGLYEMHGNVWEWCSDWYAEYPDEPAVDPRGPETGAPRVLRGGSWIGGAWICRSAYRGCNGPGGRFGGTGFRLARGQRNSQGKSGPGEGRIGGKRSGRQDSPSKDHENVLTSLWNRIKGILDAD